MVVAHETSVCDRSRRPCQDGLRTLFDKVVNSVHITITERSKRQSAGIPIAAHYDQSPDSKILAPSAIQHVAQSGHLPVSNTHSEGDRRDYHPNVAINESVLILFTGFIIQISMIGKCGTSVWRSDRGTVIQPVFSFDNK